jgi:hypothetical protein
VTSSPHNLHPIVFAALVLTLAMTATPLTITDKNSGQTIKIAVGSLLRKVSPDYIERGRAN